MATFQMALQRAALLDVPPRTRLVIGVAGVAGIGLIAMASLVSGQEQYIQTDKIIHFSGYTVLATVFILALRPILFLPALMALVAIGMGIELLQPKTGRSFDMMDQMANSVGVVVGAALGLVVRGTYAFIHTELIAADARRRLVSFAPGQVVYRQGDPSEQFYVIKSGLIEISREADGTQSQLMVLRPGEVPGAVAAIQGIPYQVTATALTPATLYRMELRELMESAKGKEDPVVAVLCCFSDRLLEMVKEREQREARVEAKEHG